MDSSTHLNLEELVKNRAYEIYKRRCKLALWQYGKLGTPAGDWKQAEVEIRGESKKCYK
jgi:hypothetical protein